MAILKKTTKKDSDSVLVAKKEQPVSLKSLKKSNIFTLIQPRVTEKAALQTETKNVYVFEVAKNASKQEIAKAVKTSYKVTPVMVRTATIKAKKVFSRGKWGVKSGGKKAYVYLKQGDKIEFV